jgi:6-phosphogluconolactonase
MLKVSRRRFVQIVSAGIGVAGTYPQSEAATTEFAFVGSFTRIEGREVGGRGITVYRIDNEASRWRETQALREVANPSFLTVDHSHRFVFSADGEDRDHATAFEINREKGLLRIINRRPLGANNGVHLCVDPSNRFLIVVMNTGSLTVFPIAPSGALEPASDVVTLANKNRKNDEEAPHPHQVQFDPSGQFFVVPDTGIHVLHMGRLDTTTGKLTLAESGAGQAAVGTAPRHLVFHPQRPFVYVMNEAGSSVAVYKHENGSLGKPVQTLPSAPPAFTGKNTGAEIVITKSGRFVYVSNRGHNSIAAFRIETDGLLVSAGWESTQGQNPRFITFDPDQRLLFVANQSTNSIVPFHVDPVLGTLSPTDHRIQADAPTCVAFA